MCEGILTEASLSLCTTFAGTFLREGGAHIWTLTVENVPTAKMLSLGYECRLSSDPSFSSIRTP